MRLSIVSDARLAFPKGRGEIVVRTINEAAHEARRNTILDAAQWAIEARGYEQVAIADLVNELRISSGAFYHYFDSKPALLEALVERTGNQIEQVVLPGPFA